MPYREHPKAKLADGVEGPSVRGEQSPDTPKNGVVDDGHVHDPIRISSGEFCPACGQWTDEE